MSKYDAWADFVDGKRQFDGDVKESVCAYIGDLNKEILIKDERIVTLKSRISKSEVISLKLEGLADIDLSDLVHSIQTISIHFKKFKDTLLNDRAILALLRDILPAYIKKKEIKIMLEAISGLEEYFLKERR